ncbi:hypothetical protein [Streptomyces chartreusis]|uniref:hypothetical protein n=1 Tax=Streptomyces chartreusis TaxID=1969 RepID=UPI00381212C6
MSANEKSSELVPALGGDELRDALRQALDRFIDPDDDTMPALDEYGFTWVPADVVLDSLVAAIKEQP